MALYRHALGYTLRNMRTERGMTLRDVSGKASMALGYLSEVERGQKEISSELLETVAVGLGTTAGYVGMKAAYLLLDWEYQANLTTKQESATVVA